MKIKSLALAIVAAAGTTTAFAGGFSLSEQSVSAMGTANAGRVSNAVDASVVFNNPAAMGELKKAQFTQAVAFIDAKTKIKNVAPLASGQGGIGGTSNGNIVPHTFIPSGYFTSGDQGGWAWGIAAYGSYGLKTNNEATFTGRHLGDKSSVEVITIQPALSYQINDKVSVGFGPTINKLDAYLSKNTESAAGQFELEGDDIGYGFNFGLHAKLTPETQVGLVYRSKVKYKIDDGTAKNSGLDSTGAPSIAVPVPLTFAASTGITLPESVEFSASHKLNSQNTLHAGATWTRWSRLQSIIIATTPTGPFNGQREDFHWKDSVGYAAGITHAYDDKLTLRAGLAYDNTPVAPADRNVRLPSADRYIVSIGAGYKLSPTQTIDASYSYLQEETAEVRVAPNLPTPGYSADYRNRASVYGLQFTQQF